MASGDCEISGLRRRTRKPPALMTPACMRAETGVGVSIVSGSQVWNGNFAHFAWPLRRRPEAWRYRRRAAVRRGEPEQFGELQRAVRLPRQHDGGDEAGIAQPADDELFCAAARAAGRSGKILAYDHSVEFLAGLGADIVDLALPIDILDLGTATAKIISAESYAILARLVDDNAQPLDQDVRPRVRAGAAISSKDYLQLLAQRQQMKIDFAAAIENLDALLTPTLTTPAMPIATIDQAGSPAMFTRWVNFLDLCAVAVPNGFTAAGLPSSLQVVCRAYQEPLALRIGYAYQMAHDWHMRVPPLAA